MNQDCCEIVVEFCASPASLRRASTDWHAAVVSVCERRLRTDSVDTFPPTGCDACEGALLLLLFPERLRAVAGPSDAECAALVAVTRRQPRPFCDIFRNFVLTPGAFRKANWCSRLDLTSTKLATIPESAFASATIAHLMLPTTITEVKPRAFEGFVTEALDLSATQIERISMNHFEGARLAALVVPPTLSYLDLRNVVARRLDLSRANLNALS